MIGVVRPVPPSRVEDVRRFNRFYTRQIGLLHEGLLTSPYSLTEVRVLYELANRKQTTAAELCQELGVDAGYLSRILRSFEKQGLISRTQSKADGRQSLLTLAPKGHRVFAPLDSRSGNDVAAWLSKLSDSQQKQLTSAMAEIQKLIAPPVAPTEPYLLRSHQPGDMGWIVHRHGVLYSQEYRYDERFEALVAEIVAEFIRQFDPKSDRCWIAERNQEIVGSIFLVRNTSTIAKLRLLLVEPSARGLGIGRRLVAECVRAGRQMGYKKIVLWTQSELRAARHLYEEAGFRLVEEKSHQSWGRDDLIAETWELRL